MTEPTHAPLVPAATAVVLRDGPDGLEVLMARRNQRLRFAAGLWVFPGGRIDDTDWPADHTPVHDLDLGDGYDTPGLVDAGRRAAVREVAEETGLELDPATLVVLSLWTPPAEYDRRFGTVFFVAPAPTGSADERPDGGEILELGWPRPSDVLDRLAAGELDMLPPTYITLDTLAGFATAAEALSTVAARTPETYGTRLTQVEGGMVARYADDVAYDSADLQTPGPRHRLWMLGSDWRYERHDDTE
ncbi:MAG TPA: NUDIX domain-containing protein [Acidimicrobiales bacterium]